MLFDEPATGWSETSGSLTTLARAWSGDPGVTVVLGTSGVAPAYWSPTDSEIGLDVQVAFGGLEPWDVGHLDRQRLWEFPVVGGMLWHETLHAKHSKHSGRHSELTHNEHEIYRLVEEIRIEGRGVRERRSDTQFLRASAQQIILNENIEQSTSARLVAILVLGRQAVGVLTVEDVLPVQDWLATLDGWTTDVFEELSILLRESTTYEDSGKGLKELHRITKRLDEIMPPDVMTEEQINDLLDLLKDILKRVTQSASSAFWERAQGDIQEARQIEERAEKVERSLNRALSENIFGKSKTSRERIPSQLMNVRQPTDAERSAAVKLSKRLKKAKYRDRVVQDVYSHLPPGRLITGAAMRKTAARSRGLEGNQHLPFHNRVRKEIDEPLLTVGIMTDVSGSMNQVQQAVGVANYVMSTAVNSIDGSVASVYFGSEVHPGLRRGERQKTVRTWSGNGGWEEFDGGFRAIEGELGLLSGSGARLLFVISDGGFVKDGQVEAANKWIAACAKSGVGVVWLQMTTVNPKKYLNLSTVEVVKVGSRILDTTDAIGLACITALKQAGK